MDGQALPNLLATIAVSVALVALVFAWMQTRHMNRSLEVVTYNGSTDLTLQLDRVFIEYPELRPYFYDGQSPTGSDIELRQRVAAVAEFALDVLECIWDHRDKYSEPDTKSWKKWIGDLIGTSPTMRDLYAEHTDWYPALQDALA